MQIKSIIIAIITILSMQSCKKDEMGSLIADNKVEIRANDTWLVADRRLIGDPTQDNRLNLVGAGSIFFSITVNTGKEVPLECYFSIEDPLKSGSDKTIIKTNPVPTFSWDPLTKKMDIHYTLNVSLMASGRDYIGHIVINGNSTGYHQQTDYLVHR